MSLFDRQLASAYTLMGVDAAFSHAGGPAITVRVIHSLDGSAVLDGMVQSIGPSLRMQASSAPQGVARGDTFAIGATTWRAREAGLPLLDGAELLVQLHKG